MFSQVNIDPKLKFNVEVTLATFHPDMSWLNNVVSLNMALIVVTLETFQVDISWLNGVLKNINDMSITFPTTHALIS